MMLEGWYGSNGSRPAMTGMGGKLPLPTSPSKAMYGLNMTMRMFGLTLVAFIGGCSDAGVLGGVEKPDLGYTLVEASDQVETGLKPHLLYERCEKLNPIVEPVRQKWSCRFGFKTSKGAQDCSATVSVHPDDHVGIWKPDIGDLDPASGKVKPNLVCKPRLAAS